MQTNPGSLPGTLVKAGKPGKPKSHKQEKTPRLCNFDKTGGHLEFERIWVGNSWGNLRAYARRSPDQCLLFENLVPVDAIMLA